MTILTDGWGATVIVSYPSDKKRKKHIEMSKAFLERAVVKLVYKFDKKSTASVWKGESTAKVPFKLFFGSYIYI